VRERWPIDDDKRSKLVDILMAIAETGEGRNRVAAARVLVAADAVNVRREDVPWLPARRAVY
jgi:hypothetical protein